MSDALGLLKTLRRLEKGELIPLNDRYDLDRNGAAQSRKKTAAPVRPLSGAARTARVFPDDKELERAPLLPPVGPAPAPLPTPMAPAANRALIPPDALLRYSLLLDDEATRTKTESIIQAAHTSSALIRAQKFVPASFLKQYHLHEELKTKALDKMFVVCVKLHKDFKRDALLYWRKLACELTLRMSMLAAVAIGRIIRGHMGRKRAKEVRALAEKSKMDLIFAKHSLSITRMQRWARRSIARQIRSRRKALQHEALMQSLSEAAAREDAVLAVEHERWNDSRVELNTVKDRSYYKSKRYVSSEIKACRLIQRQAKIFLARMKLRRMRAKRHRELMQARLDRPRQAQAVYFEHHGAAYLIQEWFRHLPRQIVRVQRRRDMIAHKVRVAKATFVQRVWRGYLSRRRVKNLRTIYIRALLRKTRAAIRLQALFRRFRARKRLTKSQLRKLNLKKRNNLIAAEKSTKIARRLSFSFPHLAIKSLENIDRMDAACFLIQKVWKDAERRRRLFSSITLIQHPAALRIARWMRSWVWRKRLRKAALVIQRQWRVNLASMLKKRNAVTKIQSLQRKRFAVRIVNDHRRSVHAAVASILSWARSLLASRLCRGRLIAMRCRYETRNSGRQMYEKTVLCTIVDELWDAVRKKKSNGFSELHKLFAQNSSNGTIDMGKTQKVLRDCGKLIGTKSTDIDVQDVELLFTRVKSPGERKLEYIQFVDLLHELAIVKYVSKMPINVDMDETNFKYCRKVGKAALVCKIIIDYIRKNSSFQHIEKEFGAECTYSRARSKVVSNALAIQRIGWGYLGRRRVAAIRYDMSDSIEKDRRYRAKLIIQRFGRSYLGRRFLVKLAQQMYVKCSDQDSKAVFWFNPRTGSSTWTKPALLRDLDCGETIRLPTENERFTLLCNECEETAASQYCDECNKAMCASCVKLLHRTAAKQGHTQVPLQMCVECEFQVPTRSCISCGDSYCDTCFLHVHRRGRLKLHTYQWLMKPCDICSNKAGQWCKVNPDNAFHVVCMCTSCFIDLNGGERPKNRMNGVFLANYCGPAIEHYRKRKSDEVHRLKMEKQNKERVEFIASQKKLKAAVDIQRIHRGFFCRKSHAAFVADRMQFLQLRKEQMPIRDSLFYKFRDYFGLSPMLDSDTPKERVLKLYPQFLRATVTDCFQRQWPIATKYLLRLDRRKAQAAKDDKKLGRISALASLLGAEYNMYRATALVKKKESSHELRRKQYRDARSAGSVNEVKRKRLQKLAHDELHNLEKAKNKLEECEISLDEIRMQWEIFAGPRGIQRMISERRRHGILLPFTVSLITGCRYARVSTNSPPLNSKDGDSGLPAAMNPDGSVRWNKYLKYADTIQLQGAFFKVISGDDFLTAYDESNEVESEAIQIEAEEEDDDESVDSKEKSGTICNVLNYNRLF